jgi:hypothetical protein
MGCNVVHAIRQGVGRSLVSGQDEGVGLGDDLNDTSGGEQYQSSSGMSSSGSAVAPDSSTRPAGTDTHMPRQMADDALGATTLAGHPIHS